MAEENELPQKSYKVILIGDSRVGKTSLRLRYMGKGFSFQAIATLGADFALKNLGDNLVQIWDLAGTQVFTFLRKQYYIGTHGAVVVFDLSNKETFDNLDYWINEVNTMQSEKIPLVLVGNKADLLETSPDPVNPEQVDAFLNKLRAETGLRIPYYQSSALTGLNVSELFQAMIDEIGF